MRATLAQVRACSAVPADTISRAVPADMRRLRPSAPEPDPTKGSDETNSAFRFVNACAQLLALAILKIGFDGLRDFTEEPVRCKRLMILINEIKRLFALIERLKDHLHLAGR